MNDSPTVRRATAVDDPRLAEVMFDAIHHTESDYSPEQKQAWSPVVRSGPEWSARLAEQWVVVAEAADDVVGFMSLADGGYIDFAYLRPSHQGRGLFRRLYDEIENEARRLEQPRLWTHASLTAEPAFRAMGFEVVRRESIEVRGEPLDRFEMEKWLAPSNSRLPGENPDGS